MNTPNGTPAHTDPVTLAREVLARDGQDIAAVLAARPGLESQALARAVIAVSALADELEAQGHRGLDSNALANVTAGMAEVAAADRIRIALNGADQ